MTTWLNFQEEPAAAGAKTKVFKVVPKEQPESNLGYIKWYGPWRTYAFHCAANCTFETTCLKDITSFITKLMLERKLVAQATKQNV